MNLGIHAVSQGLGCSKLFSLGSPNPTLFVDIGCMWTLGSFFVVRTDRLSLLDSTFGKMGNLGVRCGFYVLPLFFFFFFGSSVLFGRIFSDRLSVSVVLTGSMS